MIDVLYIEDDRSLVVAVRRLLGRAWQLDSAPSLETGVAMLGEYIYDVVLLALGLPDSAGAATYQALRESGYEGPVVVLTGHVDSKEATMLLLDGAHDVLRKDGLAGLPKALARAVRQGRLRRPSRRTLDAVDKVDWAGFMLSEHK